MTQRIYYIGNHRGCISILLRKHGSFPNFKSESLSEQTFVLWSHFIVNVSGFPTRHYLVLGFVEMDVPGLTTDGREGGKKNGMEGTNNPRVPGWDPYVSPQCPSGMRVPQVQNHHLYPQIRLIHVRSRCLNPRVRQVLRNSELSTGPVEKDRALCRTFVSTEKKRSPSCSPVLSSEVDPHILYSRVPPFPIRSVIPALTTRTDVTSQIFPRNVGRPVVCRVKFPVSPTFRLGR